MAFVRKKKQHQRHPRYCLVENRRIDGKVRQKVLLDLGYDSTPETALWTTVDNLGSQLNRKYNFELVQKSRRLRLSEQMDLDRADRMVDRLVRRIRLLRQYATTPTPKPTDKYRDPVVQRTWKNLDITWDGDNWALAFTG